MEGSIDMNMQLGHGMQYGHGHAAWTWTRSTDLVMWNEPGQWTCIDGWMPQCQQEAQSGIVSFSLVYNT
jgi:hypothetical protein